MNRHLTSLKSRLSLVSLAAVAAILVFAAVASAATSNTSSSHRVQGAVSVADAKAFQSAKSTAARKAEAAAIVKARSAVERKLQRRARTVLKKRAQFKIKVVHTRTQTKTQTVPASSTKPAAATTTATSTTPTAAPVTTTPATTVVTTTATVTAAATTSSSKVGTTATATATASATAPVTSTSTSTSPVTSTTPTTTTTTATPAGSSSAVNQPAGISGNWKMIMDSDFSSGPLNTNMWTPGWFGNGVTNPVNTDEDNCYTSQNVVPSSGALNLNVTSQASSCAGKNYPTTGSLISTNPNGSNQGFLYTYGVLESRVYVPAASNGQIENWPAVWAVTTPSETYGEDDVFEGLSGHACWHYRNDSGAPGDCDWSMTPGWHTFASDWEPGSITYYYDGVKVGQEASTSSQPMYIILDNTTSGSNLNIAGPSSMQVQYVKVWQHA